jgi:hypothetical protein
MRGLRGSVRFTSLVLLALTGAGSASAQLLVAAPPEVVDAVAHAELAYALGDGPPVTWVSLRVRRAPVALVAALPEGAAAEPGLDAWLSALETTASPRVLLPRNTTDCGETSFVEVAWPRSAGVAPAELRLESPEDVASVLAEQGLVVASELPSAGEYIVWSWSELDAARTTRTLRVHGGPAPLSFLPGSPFPIFVNAVTRGAVTYAGEVDVSGLDIAFVAGPSRHSDYRARIDSWLAGRAEPLLETRSRGLLYDWSIHSDLVSVAPLIRSYVARAGVELPDLDAKACGNALAALRVAGSDGGTTACGSARDAALALLTADPQLATLQRFVVSGARGVSTESLSGGGEPRAPTVRAKSLDATACPNGRQPPKVVDPVVSGGGPGPSSEPRGDSEASVEETVVVEAHQPVEVDCTGTPQPEPDEGYYGDDDDVDCSSDSASSSETSDSEVDCSGDTSTTSASSSDSGDSGCGDDTSSSSSDSSDSGCSDDTSSSSSDSSDSGCSDDTSSSSEEDSGYDGDTCASVSATPRATQKSQAGLTRGKRLKGSQRLKTSLWSVAFAALALPIRRRKRGARTVS